MPVAPAPVIGDLLAGSRITLFAMSRWPLCLAVLPLKRSAYSNKTRRFPQISPQCLPEGARHAFIRYHQEYLPAILMAHPFGRYWSLKVMPPAIVKSILDRGR
jgi:hypothetical protein